MPISLKAGDIMIPIDDYAVTTVDEHLRDAVRDLAKIATVHGFKGSGFKVMLYLSKT